MKESLTMPLNTSRMFFRLVLFSLLFSCSFQNKNNGSDEPANEEKPVTYSVSLKLIASSLEGPVGMASPDDGSGRIFVIQQQGKIRIIRKGQLLPVPFLDLSSKLDHVSSSYSEKGLLGIAFHPEYKSNGKFYVYYSAPPAKKGMDNSSVIAEYHVSSNGDIADSQEKILLRIDEPESNHNGGEICFGPDGYLYAGVGDGGGAGDKHGTTGNGQNINTLLGKILRIDVNTATTYGIPSDNPFVNREGSDEIFAYGLRNPWRFSFDRKTGQLFCGDVGQNEYEEIDIIGKGKNYGWRIMEGSHCYNPQRDCKTAGLTPPISEYDHSQGKSIIGGYVYRGRAFPDMEGKYIFGDWTGKIFMLLQQPGTNDWQQRAMSVKNAPADLTINSFGEDTNGEIYLIGQNSTGTKRQGMIYQLIFE